MALAGPPMAARRVASMVFAVLLRLVAVTAEAPGDGRGSGGAAVDSEQILQKIEEVTRDFNAYRAQRSGDIARLEALIRAQRPEQPPAAEVQADEVGVRMKRGGRRAAHRRLNAAPTLASLSAGIADVQGALDHAWLLLCGALVMLMQAGFAMVEGGCCRSRNVQNILLKNLTDVCVGTLCWWAFGWMFAYGPIEGQTKFAGNTQYFGHDFMLEPAVGTITSTSAPRDWFFQWAFSSAAATIVSGGMAERVNFPGYLIYTIFMTTLIYPVVVAWTWSGNGWLQGGSAQQINDVGYYDFAGSGIVHMCGGVGALVGAAVLGPRNGRFGADAAPEGEFDPHSLPLIVLGTFILWFGWYGFNCGSTLGMSSTATGQLAAAVAMNTTIAAATGGIAVLVLRLAMYRKYDVGGMCNGILAGLVSITAPCGNVESGSAFVIGLIGALIYQGASLLLRKLKVDDPIDAFPVHGACGAWGTLAAVIFDWGDGIGIFHGWGGFTCTMDGSACMDGARGKAFVANFVGILAIASWTGLLSAAVLVPLKLGGLLRAADEVQEKGMDAAKHSPPKAYTLEVGGQGASKAWAA